jgi:poly-gamma-glutamate synthesis protein (capsule biosynthesis protein)
MSTNIVVAAASELDQNPQQPEGAPATTQTPVPACNVADGFTLAAVGDLIFSEPLSGLQDEPFEAMLSRLHSADATFGNLENTLIDLQSFPGYPQAESGGGHLRGSPAVAKDLRNMGFNLVSRANNHTTDWGIEGMRATDQAADQAGLVHAGTGYNRAAARAAHYLQTARGRVALVSMALSNRVQGATGTSATPMSLAADPVGRAPGRPGLNALRIKPYTIVSPEMMQSLRQIHDALPPAALQAEAQEKRVPRPEKQEEEEKTADLSLFGRDYRVGDKAVRFAYDMNDNDLREILKSIRQGKQNSDFLIATVHAHEPDNWSEEPADFLPKLAHAAIDAGADAFIGHGPHRLRAIEIYQGKPIFYSLGNFFFQVTTQEPVPAGVWEEVKGDPNALTENEVMAKLLKGWFDAPVWYQSVIAVSRFEHGKVAEVRLYAVDLGFTAKGVNQGIPRLASPAVAKTVLEELQRLSKPYGTTLAIEDGVGIIRLQEMTSASNAMFQLEGGPSYRTSGRD